MEDDPIAIVEISQQAPVNLIKDASWLSRRYLSMTRIYEWGFDCADIAHRDRCAGGRFRIETFPSKAAHQELVRGYETNDVVAIGTE